MSKQITFQLTDEETAELEAIVCQHTNTLHKIRGEEYGSQRGKNSHRATFIRNALRYYMALAEQTGKLL